MGIDVLRHGNLTTCGPTGFDQSHFVRLKLNYFLITLPLVSDWSSNFNANLKATISVFGLMEGALECNLTGGAHFLRISTTRLGKKIAFRYPVSELLDYNNIKNNRETIVCCS